VAALFAKPPSERGWYPHPVGVNLETGQFVYVNASLFGAEWPVMTTARGLIAVKQWPDRPEVDATFENETRLHR
jgi:hypothetical protein